MRLSRQQIRQHVGDTIYIYGESQRQGNDYQDDCNLCRYEGNCYGITTCRCFALNEKDRIFKPQEFEGIQWRIITEIQSIPILTYIETNLIYCRDKIDYTVIAMPLLGKGASLMERETPDLYLFMVHELKKRFPKIQGL
jgi:hypothetical protein